MVHKHCIHCGKRLRKHIYPNGTKEGGSAYRRRTYCHKGQSVECYEHRMDAIAERLSFTGRTFPVTGESPAEKLCLSPLSRWTRTTWGRESIAALRAELRVVQEAIELGAEELEHTERALLGALRRAGVWMVDVAAGVRGGVAVGVAGAQGA